MTDGVTEATTASTWDCLARGVAALLLVVATAACSASPPPASTVLDSGVTVGNVGSASGGTANSRASGGGTTAPGSGAIRPTTDPGPVDAGYTGQYWTVTTVLETRGSGPMLCVGAVTASLPPGCSGPRIVGWSWQSVAHESRAGVTWGDYQVVGRFDGTTFTLTEAARPVDPTAPSPFAGMHRTTFDTPCPAPAGGWHPVTPATTTDAAFEKAILLARARSDFGGLWIDSSPKGSTSPTPSVATTAESMGYNDPTRFVLNVATTGDLAAVTRALRTVWGGALCVSRAAHSYAELQRIQQEVVGSPPSKPGIEGVLGAGIDEMHGMLELTVIRSTTQLRKHLDATYGPGVVRVTPSLIPID